MEQNRAAVHGQEKHVVEAKIKIIRIQERMDNEPESIASSIPSFRRVTSRKLIHSLQMI